MALVNADLYEGKGRRALERVNAAWQSLSRSLLRRIQLIRIEGWQFRARATLAVVVETGDTTLLPSVERDARRVAREGAPFSHAMAQLLTAAVAWQHGRESQALAKLREAVAGFESAELVLAAVATRWTLGRALGGDEGLRLCSEAEKWMLGQSIRVPERVARMVAPGFERRVA